MRTKREIDGTPPSTASPPESVLSHPIADPVKAVRSVGLRYVPDSIPGITRRRTRSGFRYLTPDGAPLRDPDEIRRISALAIPPAYTDVWICPRADGYLQATGRDARGRKQYRYHPRWRAVRDENKYAHLLAFADALPRIRERVEHDLALPGMPRDKVLATVVRLLETTLIRIGNEEYARTNRSYGLTTLRNRHVAVTGATVRFHFRGKSGKMHTIDLKDRRLARIVRRCRELPGQELFQYQDEDGAWRPIGSGDVNAYLHEIAGQEFTAKDFRTWAGTVLALCALRASGSCPGEADLKKNVVRAVETVAERLGNTPAVCRKCYIHPVVIASYLDGVLQVSDERDADSASSPAGLSADESALVDLLRTGQST